MKFFAVLAAFAVAAVSADNIISVTSPLTNTVYTAGQSAIISWVNPTVPKISQIVFSKGPSTALQPVSVIATNVDTASGSYTWNIPADTPSGSDYAFVFGTSPNQSYTGQFIVKGAAAGSAPVAPAAGAPAAAPASGNSANSASTPSGSSAPASSTPKSAGNKAAVNVAALTVAGVAAAAYLL